MSISAYRLELDRATPLETSATSPDELSRQLPRGLYTTFSTNSKGTRVLGLSEHLDRLYIPAQADGIRPSTSPSILRAAISKFARDFSPGESRFRILLSASDGELFIIVQPFTPLSSELYKKGVKVITTDFTRQDPRRKDSAFINASRAERSKLSGDVHEILLTKNGKIFEGMTSNFYAIVNTHSFKNTTEEGAVKDRYHVREPDRDIDATLVTARLGVLLGVTRRVVLGLVKQQGIPINYRAPRLDESFSEAFITSSSRGIVPVVSVDGRGVGEGIVGFWTHCLIQAYATYVKDHSELITP